MPELHPVAPAGAVTGGAADERIDPTTGGVVVAGSVSVGGPMPDDAAGDLAATRASSATAATDLGALVGTAAAPAAPASLVSGNTLPGSGAYETAPSGSSAGVAIPVGTVAKPTRGATITTSYTQGTSGGAMAVKVYQYDGSLWGQIASPVDQSYNGDQLGSGTGVYELAVELKYGAARIMVCGAEIGVTGTPGTYSAEVVFG
jgi:hypothetical protein